MKPTQEQVMAWAREAGWDVDEMDRELTDWFWVRLYQVSSIAYEAGYEAGRKDENEACAEILEANAEACVMNSTVQQVLRSNAKAIRARREQ